jgi:hypothetical protein
MLVSVRSKWVVGTVTIIITLDMAIGALPLLPSPPLSSYKRKKEKENMCMHACMFSSIVHYLLVLVYNRRS